MPKVNVKILEMMGRKKIRTIQELHEITGISRTLISNVINGKRSKLRLDTIAKLCEALDCEIYELIEINKDGQVS